MGVVSGIMDYAADLLQGIGKKPGFQFVVIMDASMYRSIR